jgi:hypothetical protein
MTAPVQEIAEAAAEERVQRVVLASAQRQRCGITAVAAGGRSLAVLVLPKLWRHTTREARQHATWPAGADAWACTLYEGETCVLDVTPDQARLVDAALTESEAAAKRRTRGSHSRERGPASVPLLTPAALRPDTFAERVKPVVPEPLDLSAGQAPDPAEGLVLLLALAERAQAGERAVDALGRPHAACALRPLLHLRFVREVERRLRHAKHGYIAVEETTTAIRGRLVAASVVEALMTGMPALRCVFDEFAPATPLLMVIAAALQRVATAAVDGLLGTSPTFRQHLAKAVHMRRALTDVPEMPPVAASRLARTVRLDRTTAGWSSALKLARAVLDDAAALPFGAGREETVAAEFDVPTWRVWEGALYEALRVLERGGVVTGLASSTFSSGVDAPAPWRSVTRRSNARDGTPGRSAPDLVFEQVAAPTERWCVDAKYRPLDATGPTRGERLQMFAYSYLVSSRDAEQQGRPVTRCALVYAAPARARMTLSIRRFRRGIRTGEPASLLPLYALAAPFPGTDAVRDEDAWARYLDDLAAALAPVFSARSTIDGAADGATVHAEGEVAQRVDGT